MAKVGGGWLVPKNHSAEVGWVCVDLAEVLDERLMAYFKTTRLRLAGFVLTWLKF